MLVILSVTLPFFGLVLCGWLGARQGILPAAAIPGLNAFVLYFALPCMLYRFGSSLPIERLIDPGLLAVWLTSALLMVFMTLGLTWARRPGTDGVDLRDAAFGALVAAFPNTGLMGVPLLAALLGAQATGPAIGTMVIDLMITSTLCVTIAQAQHHPVPGSPAPRHVEPSGPWRAALRAFVGALKNPLPWAIALGALAAVLQLRLPGPLDEIVRLLGDAATPVALFTIGSVLWRASRHAHTRTPARRYLPVALLKLVLHPVLVLGLGLGARATGIAVPDEGLMVLVLVAALPSASNVAMLAERFGADNGRIARIIMASTVLSFGSFSLIAWLFGVSAR